MNIENKRLRYVYLVPWYGYESPLSTYTKEVQTSHVWCHNDVIIADYAENADSQWSIDQNLNFRQKVTNIKISPVVLLIKERNVVFYIYCKIIDHTIKIYFQIVISNIAGLHQPPPSYFDGLHYPGKDGTQLFFIKMTAKDVNVNT